MKRILLPILRILALIAALAQRARGRTALANIAEGTHSHGVFTFRTDASLAERYLLMKRGSDDAHVAVAGAGEVPPFVCLDEASAAEDPVACQALACANGTIKLVTNGAGALAAGDLVVPAASGRVAKIAAGAGNYYVVGMVVAAVGATAGEVFEAIPIGAWKTQ
jgi:hypothetical protein